MQHPLHSINEHGNGNCNDNGKKKIIIKKKRPEVTVKEAASSLSFRLIDFNIYDQNVEMPTAEEQGLTPSFYQNKKMVIQIFGINESGETCALLLKI